MKIPVISQFSRAFLLIAGIVLLSIASNTRAASVANDNASSAPYADGWQSGDNGGTGFGAWSLSSSDGSSGQFIGNSSQNGGYEGKTGIGNPAFGYYSDSGGLSNSVRSFTGSLSVGQSFGASYDNGYLSNGGVFGLQLLTSSDINNNPTNPSNPRFGYYFYGGQGNYRVTGDSQQSTNVGFTDAGMNTTFTLTGTNTYSFSVQFLNNDGTVSSTESFTGNLGGVAGSTIDGFRIFSYNIGNGGQNDAFSNNFSVTGADVPEPATVCGGLLMVGTLVLQLKRRRQSGFTLGTDMV